MRPRNSTRSASATRHACCPRIGCPTTCSSTRKTRFPADCDASSPAPAALRIFRESSPRRPPRPGSASPAGSVAARHIRADYQDPHALAELAELAAAATTEFENVPAAALDYLARSLRVTPAAASVAIAQDRISEKTFLAGHGFAV